MQRAEVWWADLPAPAGRRPVVLVSRERAIHVRDSVTIAQVTSTTRHIPTEVPLDSEDGLPRPCVVNCDVLQTIPKSLLSKRISLLSHSKRGALDLALAFALGLD
jgi:mRNA interferase MazF